MYFNLFHIENKFNVCEIVKKLREKNRKKYNKQK